MEWDVEVTDEFEAWWDCLDCDEQESLAMSVNLLRKAGPKLTYPHSSGIKHSRFGEMRELRTQHQGRPYRTLYAFDPRRSAILLLGGDKTGDDRWYDKNVPKAEKIYEHHLKQLRKEGLL